MDVRPRQNPGYRALNYATSACVSVRFCFIHNRRMPHGCVGNKPHILHNKQECSFRHEHKKIKLNKIDREIQHLEVKRRWIEKHG